MPVHSIRVGSTGEPWTCAVIGVAADFIPKYAGGPGAVLSYLASAFEADGDPGMLAVGFREYSVAQPPFVKGVLQKLGGVWPAATLYLQVKNVIQNLYRYLSSMTPLLGKARILHGHDIYAFQALQQFRGHHGKLQGPKSTLVLSMHGPGSFSRELGQKYEVSWPNKPGLWILHHFEMPALEACDVLVTPSRGAFELLNRDFMAAGIDTGKWRNKLKIIHNGIPDTQPQVDISELGQELRRAHNLSEQDFLIFSAGRLIRDRGFEVILQMASAMREKVPHLYNRSLFAIAGSGPDESQLIHLAGKLECQDRVRFLGYRDDVDRWLAVADIVISLSHRAAFDLFVLEAMRQGKPVVATDVGGNREILEDCGILVPPGKVDAALDALLGVLNSPEERRVLAAAARQRFERLFTIKHMAAAYKHFYEGLMRGDAD